MPNGNQISPPVKEYLHAIYDRAVTEYGISSETSSEPLPDFEETLDTFFVHMGEHAMPFQRTLALSLPSEFIANQYNTLLQNLDSDDINGESNIIPNYNIQQAYSGVRIQPFGSHSNHYVGITKEEALKAYQEDSKFLFAILADESDPLKLSGELIAVKNTRLSNNQLFHESIQDTDINNKDLLLWKLTDGKVFKTFFSSVVVRGNRVYLSTTHREYRNKVSTYLYTGNTEKQIQPLEFFLQYNTYLRSQIADLYNLSLKNSPLLASHFEHTKALLGLGTFIYGGNLDSELAADAITYSNYLIYGLENMFSNSDKHYVDTAIHPLTYASKVYSKNKTGSGVAVHTDVPEDDLPEISLNDSFRMQNLIDTIVFKASESANSEQPTQIKIRVIDNSLEILISGKDLGEYFTPTNLETDHQKAAFKTTPGGTLISIKTPLSTNTSSVSSPTQITAIDSDLELREFLNAPNNFQFPAGWLNLYEDQKLAVLVQIYDMPSNSSLKDKEQMVRTAIRNVIDRRWVPSGLAKQWNHMGKTQRASALQYVIRESRLIGNSPPSFYLNPNLLRAVNAAQFMRIGPIIK